MNPDHGQDETPPTDPAGPGGESYPDPGEGPEYEQRLPHEPQIPYEQEVSYDPGAAFVEESAYYGEPAYAPGETGCADPGDAAYDPNQVSYEAPGQPGPYHGGGYEEPASPAPAGYGVYDDSPPAPAAPKRRQAPAPKKAGHRAPRKTPSTTGPAGRRPVPKPVVYGGGVSPVTVLLTLVALGMLAVVVMVAVPKDMSAVAGYAVALADGAKPRNLLVEAQKIMIDRNAELSLTEEEVNRYLNHRLSGSQSGMMAAFVKFRGVYIDFSPAKAEVVIEREVFGKPVTMSVDLATEQVRRQIQYHPSAWHIGKVSLGSRTVAPVVELFTRLRGTLLDEYQTIQQMSDVRFEENRVVLDARI